MTRAEQLAAIFDEFNSSACECECEAGDCIADRAMADEIIRLRVAIERVRKLHSRLNVKGWKDSCGECEHGYPCDTLRALDGDA